MLVVIILTHGHIDLGSFCQSVWDFNDSCGMGLRKTFLTGPIVALRTLVSHGCNEPSEPGLQVGGKADIDAIRASKTIDY